jgi:hypothetical protein
LMKTCDWKEIVCLPAGIVADVCIINVAR